MSRTLAALLFVATLFAVAFASEAGDMLKVTTDAEIGILLEEYPQDTFQRAKSWALSQPDSFWDKAVERQMVLTAYKLTFRASFKPRVDGKRVRFQMLFHYDMIEITYREPAKFKVIDGKKHVSRHYDMLTYVLGKKDTVVLSEPDLAEIGSTISEYFYVPIDPFLHVQRVGYACMDEGGFPLDSVDAENPEYFYDDECTGEEPLEEYGGTCRRRCHCADEVDVSCVDAVHEHTGGQDLYIHFERVAWDEQIAQAYEAKNKFGEQTEGGADLVGRPDGIAHHWVSYQYIEEESCTRNECVVAKGWRRLLNFDAIHVNKGSAHIEIGPLKYNNTHGLDETNPLTINNLFYYDSCHEHPHFEAFANFDFGGVAGHKQGFCIMSTGRDINSRNTSIMSENYGCSNQGIPMGWSDAYQGGIPCNWVDVTDVDVSAGEHSAILSDHVNPKNWLCEGEIQRDEEGEIIWEFTGEYTATGQPINKWKCVQAPTALDNNVNEAPFTLGTKGNGKLTSECTHEGEKGPNRDCELSIRTHMEACTPGEPVNLSCRLKTPSSPAQVLRVCEASIALQSGTACRLYEPNNNVLSHVVLRKGGASVPVSFTCPAARDEVEVGGFFATYSGPVLNGIDEAAEIVCTAA